MNQNVNAIAGRLSLRPPQRRSLEILDRITEIAPPKKNPDIGSALDAIASEFPSVTDFEREFPSLCFALATGVGKTRLMGAFISYLHLSHGINNFFVLAPNLTIYNKLITDFTPNTPKYVFTGITRFATEPPAIITGDNYEGMAGTLFDQLHLCKVNIFNISKINSEVRGGKSPRIKRLSEYIGQSYFDYLAGLPDLVLIMDESHRYRASAGVRAINELRPVMGLELTATPFVETNRGPVPFKNVIYDYALGRAMADGFVKEPAVVTRKNFDPNGMSTEEIEKLKLEDGVRLHESVKVHLETYARETGKAFVKPFLLVIARDTTHASQLLQQIESEGFFAGRYKGKVIQVDSSRTGKEEEEMIERLLRVEHAEEPTEIVIHVNMLKEGWDVTNLYTIVPLRAANARTLVEQSIGRGLRLPYGKRTGVEAVDQLNIVAHDRFQEIVDDSRKVDSPIQLKTLVLDDDELEKKTVTVVSQSRLAMMLGIQPQQQSSTTVVSVSAQPVFTKPEEQKVAQITCDVIRELENQPTKVASLAQLTKPDIQAEITREVTERWTPAQLGLEGVVEVPDIAAIVAKTIAVTAQQTINIPRILVVPQGEVRSGFKEFRLDLSNVNYQPISNELWQQELRTGKSRLLTLGEGAIDELRLEDYVVSGLVDFDDVSYDDHADLLYDLATQTVQHFLRYVNEEDTRRILRVYQKEISRLIHAQMEEHYWEEAVGYEVQIKKGFTELKPERAYAQILKDSKLDFRQAPADKSNMSRYLFTGFARGLYATEKFQSDSERMLSVILDRESLKWFKPAKGQFQIYYKWGAEHPEYQPDFVAETQDAIYMLEPKARNQMEDAEVLAKRDAAVEWCNHASDYAATYDGKPWKYLLIPHDAIAENMTLEGLAERFAC
ncbi:MAG TPA: DEAD/DEAH box helicase family protein [Pyrinomonadaceae bacterium]|nr:DEAD/DEAH box helicase family protein [Pyrinomonadaceae bacterium]